MKWISGSESFETATKIKRQKVESLMLFLCVSECLVAGKAYRLERQLLDSKNYYIFTWVDSLLLLEH